MAKLQKIQTNWYLTDSTIEPENGSIVLFNGEATVTTFVNTENKTCIVPVLGMTKNVGFEEVEVIVDRIDEVNVDDLLTKISRVEVIDEKGRSYVKYLSNQKVTFSFQDEDRTLKVFIDEKNISK